jgi:hypothetical protein
MITVITILIPLATVAAYAMGVAHGQATALKSIRSGLLSVTEAINKSNE